MENDTILTLGIPYPFKERNQSKQYRVLRIRGVKFRMLLREQFLLKMLYYHTITNNAICRHKIKSKSAVAKTAFNRKTVFDRKFDLNIKKKLLSCYIWSTAL